MGSLARRLGSVALRYRRPAGRPPWSASSSDGVCRRLWTTSRERPTTPADGPTARSQRMARLEAVLFVAREPLGSRKLADLAGLADGTEARTLVRKLNRVYDLEGCAFRAVEVAGGFQLMSRPKFVPWLRRLGVLPVEVHLSPPVMETLAVVAYRQPVLRADVEAVRGVQCGEVLRQLMERELVRIVGRSEELGRPFLYGTTKQFLQVFGLRHLDELPRPQFTQATRPEGPDDGPAERGGQSAGQETSSPLLRSSKTEGESNVTSTADTTIAPEVTSPANVPTVLPGRRNQVSQGDDEFDDDDYDEEEYEEEEEEDEDEGIEDEEWEEVGGDDEDEDDDDWDDDEEDDDEDWDDEDDEDWNDDEEDDWDDEDEDEEDDSD